jgi:hypothetical protein
MGMIAQTEKRLALVHRVLVPDNKYPKEYAILVTDTRSIFIRQPKTRNSFVLRGEMKFGTALVTDVEQKKLEDYDQTSLDSLSADNANLVVPHQALVSFTMNADKVKLSLLDFVQRITMRMQNEIFQVYNFRMKLQKGSPPDNGIVFYAVPLGAYFKPKRQTQTRETILREYATEILEVYRKVLPAGIISLEQAESVAA